MFDVTAFGNHSWLIEAGGSRLLIDPTLSWRYGPTEAQGIAIYPPRTVLMELLPAIDAVYISHEHEGHFEIPTLARLPRTVPIYLSENCSLAAREILAEMGFVVKLARAGRPISVGELVLVPVAGDQIDVAGDEWDNLGALVFDRAGHGSFFSTIDNFPRPEDLALARRFVARPGIWAVTANETDAEFGSSLASVPPPLGTNKVAEMLEIHARLEDEWEAPAALVLVGGGFCFTGEHAWLNETVFPIDPERVVSIVGRLLPQTPVRWPIPGQTLRMRDGALSEVLDRPFVRRPPRESWPRRGAGAVSWVDELLPITHPGPLSPAELALLQEELKGLAEHLYDRRPFHRLYSLSPAMTEGKEPALALVLHDGPDGDAFVFVYDPCAADFVRVDEADPVATYALVYEAWATDLLAALRFEISNHAMSDGHSRHWLIEGELFDLNIELLGYLTPTRMPERALSRYRGILNRAISAQTA